jgi:hypothetical protein
MMSFPLLRARKHTFSSLPSFSLPFRVLISVVRACSSMPKLRLPYLQIKEQTARDIRTRTEMWRGQLLEEHRQRTARDKGTQTEDFEDTDSETEDCEDTKPRWLVYKAQLCFLVLLLFFLLYHACK